MFVNVAKLVLQIPEAGSLKARRQVVRSFKDRLRSRLPVSVAEVGDVEKYQVAELGVVMVSGDAVRCKETIGKVIALANSLPDAVLAEVRTELFSFGEGGRQLPLRLHPLVPPTADVGELPWGDGGSRDDDKEES